MDLTKITYFLTAAKLCNFTKASAACHIGQTTMSKYIASLEKELGFPLFERNHKDTRLTAKGQIFYRRMTAIREDYESLLAELHAAPAPGLRLGIALQEYLSIPLLKDFQTAHPEHPLYFSFRPEKALWQDWEENKLDAIISPDAIPMGQSMAREELQPMAQSLVCSRALLSTHGSIEDVIAAEPLITKTENPLYHEQCKRRCLSSFGVSFPSVLVCPSLVEQLMLTGLSKGFAILALTPSYSYSDLEILPLGEEFQETVQLLYKETATAPALTALLSFIHEKKCST